jgi:2-phospho-L-lactate guanylyltransferase
MPDDCRPSRRESIAGVRWQLLVPVKASAGSKSRLAGATREPSRHLDLVRAMQRDSLQAAHIARDLSRSVPTGPQIGQTHLLGPAEIAPLSDGAEEVVLDDHGLDLNGALSRAAELISRQHRMDGVAVLVADLPALRAEDLLTVLGLAEEHARAFVPDRAGSGTTMLLARPGYALRPAFGPGSARRHLADGAVSLSAPSSARTDVDTAADLWLCLALGVGRHTADMAGHLV